MVTHLLWNFQVFSLPELVREISRGLLNFFFSHSKLNFTPPPFLLLALTTQHERRCCYLWFLRGSGSKEFIFVFFKESARWPGLLSALLLFNLFLGWRLIWWTKIRSDSKLRETRSYLEIVTEFIELFWGGHRGEEKGRLRGEGWAGGK